MLSVHISPGHITRCQNHYLAQGWSGAETADEIRIIARKLEGQARSFLKRQQRGADSILPDGAFATLDEALFRGSASHGWPWGAAHFLAGLQLDKSLPLASSLTIGSESFAGDDCYCAPMTFGPVIARVFGKLIALVVYLHPVRQLWVAWIGPETDLASAREALRLESENFAQWPDLVPDP